MTPEELHAIKRLMQEMRWSVSLRKTRRRVRRPQRRHHSPAAGDAFRREA